MGNLAVLGSGSFARQVVELARQSGHEVVACYSMAEGAFGDIHRGYLAELEADRDAFDGVILGVSATDRRSLAVRRSLVDWLIDREFACPPLVSPMAFCSEGVELADGAIVSHGAILGLDCRIGAFSICNSGTMIGHQVNLGSNVVVAPGAFIGDAVTANENVLIGPLAKVLQGLTLASDTLVGAGCLMLRDLAVGQSLWPQLDRTNRGSGTA